MTSTMYNYHFHSEGKLTEKDDSGGKMLTFEGKHITFHENLCRGSVLCLVSGAELSVYVR